MNFDAIIAQIDFEIQRLQHARSLLQPAAVKKGPGRPKGSGSAKAVVAEIAKTVKAAPAAKRTMSEEGRARIAAAQKARWAKAKRLKK